MERRLVALSVLIAVITIGAGGLAGLAQRQGENLEQPGQVGGAAEARIWVPVVFVKRGCSEPGNETRGGACGPLMSGEMYYGTMESSDDNWDWYYFDVGTTHAVEAWLSDIPAGCDYDLYLYDASDERVGFSGGIGGVDEHIVTEPLPPSRYYLVSGAKCT